MKISHRGALLGAASLLAALAATGTAAQTPVVPPDIMALHQKMLVLDTHSDTPSQTLRRPGFDITKRHSYADDNSQIDLPRMNDGGYDGGWFVVYTGSGPLTKDGYEAALAHAMWEAAKIREVAAEHPKDFEFARTAADAQRIVAAGKKAVFMSMENSYPLGEDLRNLAAFQQLGLTMASPVHSRNNQLADSTTDTPKWNGLSPLGKQWVAEMNRLGVLIDVSHSADKTIDDVLALSKVPIIASHHGARVVWNHPRNADDNRLKAIAAKGGVIQVNSIFLGERTRPAPAPGAARPVEADLNEIGPAEQAQALKGHRADFEKYGMSEKVDFDTFMNAVLYILKLVGPDHVGIGPDWDGGGGVNGMIDISYLPKITERLKKAGYSDADIQKIWSGNVLRVLAQAQAGAGK